MIGIGISYDKDFPGGIYGVFLIIMSFFLSVTVFTIPFLSL